MAENDKGQQLNIELSEEIADVMKITGFINFFTTYNTVEEALKTLNGNTE